MRGRFRTLTWEGWSSSIVVGLVYGLEQHQLGKRSNIAPLSFLHTNDMRLDKSRELIENQLRDIDLSESLLQPTTAMSEYLETFIDEQTIGRDPRIPRIDEFPDYDGKESVQLTIHLVGARERREYLFQRLHSGSWTEHPADKGGCGPIVRLVDDQPAPDGSGLAAVIDERWRRPRLSLHGRE